MGVTLDSRLTWQHQFRSYRVYTDQFINLLRRLHRLSWGVDPRLLQRLYTHVFEAKLYYCSMLHATNLVTFSRRMESLQHEVLCNVFTLPRSTPLYPLFYEIGTPPFWVQSGFLAEKFLLRRMALITCSSFPQDGSTPGSSA